ncbi:ATPase [Paenibacillus thiaminolyticus]|uniref:ATPase n=1 Tax=Paenibacillus thiaminolyticus TaxID=49283 RepID=A0AAP9J1P1_PANTH|nr:BadF/BadG/BcrA/BcrD ATPase family protein [Paenibacillus thiaminolyticus]MCY9536557.1 ATPase [Paenibacillus thiaminolyticus]MCY9601542.1 ATPase [Paenibacillus thiaminolyticus]MCY9608966.1 ATPase [Paenibacillus thiaminolyticus]MCY9612167.1 ATPase [Paenibacillus thiaminolyticus]MCY9619602.1 ATPase [Paenibacillus thiaminolyticus]
MGNIVIGIDGGGTTTRVMTASLDGAVIAYAENGCCNPNKDVQAKQHVRDALQEAAARSGGAPIAALCAGLAGLESEQDMAWAEEFTDAFGAATASIVRRHVNDGMVAHAGAFLGEPGIMAVAGTGSVVFGVNEAGRIVRNQDFHHYATAARFLSYEAVYKIIAGYAAEADQAWVGEILRYWGAASVDELSELGAARGFVCDEHERMRRFGEMAPYVTRAAGAGVPLARLVCDEAASALEQGIRIVGSRFSEETLSVAFVGSVIRDPYIRRIVAERLQQAAASTPACGRKRFRVIEPALSPVAGAIVLALQSIGVAITPDILARLQRHPRSQSSD